MPVLPKPFCALFGQVYMPLASLAQFSDFALKALLRMPGVKGTRSSFIMQEIKNDLAWAPRPLARPMARPGKARL